MTDFIMNILYFIRNLNKYHLYGFGLALLYFATLYALLTYR